jgi:hypothetical protein
MVPEMAESARPHHDQHHDPDERHDEEPAGHEEQGDLARPF